MPKGILTRLIVELHEYIEVQQLVWKTGVVLTNGSARAEVIEHYPKSEIRIRVSGNDQKRWLSAITHELEKIHGAYDRLQYQTLIPCNCSKCKGNQAPHDYPYQVLQQFLNDRQYTIQCQKSYQMVDVRRLLDDILYSTDPFLHPERGIRLNDHSQGLPFQDTSNILNTAQKQVYQEPKPKTVLSPKDRLKLIRKINGLSQSQFEEFAFALDPPKGVVSSAMNSQGNRAKEVLEWVESPTGIGLQMVLDILDEFGVTLTD